MIFNFLKYIKPIWYFNLKSNKDFGYFPTIEHLQKHNFNISRDFNYLSIESQNRDLAYRAFQSGFINKSIENNFCFLNQTILPIPDEYRFLRKNFNQAWVFYILIIRILTLNNPFKEWAGFFKTRKTKLENYAKNIYEYPDYQIFESSLINQNPLISIIIPTLNRYKYLKDVFKDLENQTYKNFEVIVVDQTDFYQKDFYNGWKFDLKFWHQTEKALWKARNEAIQAAKGDYILMYDDDSLVENDWIYQHLKTLDFFEADISSGVSISKIGDKVPAHYSYFRWSDQLDTGNVLLKKAIFKTTGLFDRQFEQQRMGDGEFGLRCYLSGYKNISNHKAKRIHLKVSEGGLRQMGSWDGWRPQKLFGPRPVPSVLYFSRKYFGNTAARYFVMVSILPSLIPYQFKSNKILKISSFFLFPFLAPLIVYQVYKSWSLASLKIKQGGIIAKF